MRFRGTTEEGEVVEFKSYCKDSDHVIEYGSEIGIQKNIWKYVKKDSLICVEVEELESQLAEAREVTRDAIIQLGYYSACGGTQATEFLDRNKEFIKQLKEKGDE